MIVFIDSPRWKTWEFVKSCAEQVPIRKAASAPKHQYVPKTMRALTDFSHFDGTTARAQLDKIELARGQCLWGYAQQSCTTLVGSI